MGSGDGACHNAKNRGILPNNTGAGRSADRRDISTAAIDNAKPIRIAIGGHANPCVSTTRAVSSTEFFLRLRHAATEQWIPVSMQNGQVSVLAKASDTRAR